MDSANCWFVVGLFALVLIYGALVGLMFWAAFGDRRDARRRAQACDCPGPELPSLGVQYHPAGAELPTRALLEAERTGRDEIGVILQPTDGSDQAAIHMPRATADAFAQLLAHARNQEVRQDG